MAKKTIAAYASEHYVPGRLLCESKAETIRFNKIAELAGEKGRVLDVGCYDGSLGKRLISNKNEVYGIEINEECAKIAKKIGMKVIIQDLTERFDLPDGTFDVVTGGEIIEHILDTDSFIDEISRVLKPGGRLILSTPNAASFGRRLLLLFGKNAHFEASFGFPPNATAGHIRFFTRDLLEKFLESKGFRILKFSSDIVNFDGLGRLSSASMAKIFPTLGRSLIVLAQKKK